MSTRTGCYMMEILKLYGTPYENGYTSGKYFSRWIKPDLSKPVAYLQKYPIFRSYVGKMMAELEHRFDVYYAETIGKADGLGIDRTVYCALMCTEEITDHDEHCSTIMIKNQDGSISLCHNEDDIYVEGNFVIAHVKEPDGTTFYTNDMYNMPFGNGFCINSNGLVRTINFCYENSPHQKGLSRFYSQRHIAGSLSLSDMIRRIGESKPASGYHINLVDTMNHYGYSIEVHPDKVCAVILKDFMIHTNHYVHGIQEEEWNTDPLGNSEFRYHRIRQLLCEKQKCDMNALCDILSDHTEDPVASILQCHAIQNQTIFRFMYDGIKDESSLYSYVHDDKFPFQEEI